MDSDRENQPLCSELLALFEELHEAKESHMEIALLLWDLSAAFDTIEPSILIRKLECYGFDRIAIEWMTSYLKNRKQAVSVEGKVSTTLDIDIGTPQGSRISPLQHLTYFTLTYPVVS